MKSTTYARLFLFLPYLCLIAAWVSLYRLDLQTASGAALHSLSFVWVYSGLFWIVPYTHLVICLLLWSRGKSVEMIAIVYSLAPCALAVVTLIAYAIVQVTVWIDTGQLWEGLDIFATTSMITVLADLVIGYLFVGIALLFFAVLKRAGLIKDEHPPESAVQRPASLPPG